MNATIQEQPLSAELCLESNEKPDMFSIWVSSHLIQNVRSTLSLVELHNSYRNFVLNQGFVPMKKLGFSSSLKKYFALKINRGEISVNSVSKVYFEGLSFKENPDFRNTNKNN